MRTNRTPDDNQTVMPHSTEAEQQFLGALLSDNDLFHKDGAQLSPDAFYEPIHGFLYEAIAEKVGNGQLASPITLKSVVEGHDGMQQVGGSKYVVRLLASAISSFSVAEYAQLIRDAHAKRQLINAMEDANARIAHGVEPASEIAASVETTAGQVQALGKSKPLIRSHLSSLTGAIKQVNDAMTKGGAIGVPTGLPQLDHKINLLRSGDLVVLAGRPGMGKTSVAQNIAYHAANNGIGVFFGSLEMSGEQLGIRFVSKGLAEQNKNIAYNRMLGGRLSEAEMRDFIAEAKRQQALPLFVGEREIRVLSRLRAAARRAQQALADTPTPLGLIVVDYIQRVDTDHRTKDFREKVAIITDTLKSMAMDFGVPVVALSQLNREVERRDNKRPLLADLKESGSLEEDADVVLFCYREAYYLKQELDAYNGSDVEHEADLNTAYERTKNNLEIIVAKQRSGEVGTVHAYISAGLCHVYANRAEQDGWLI